MKNKFFLAIALIFLSYITSAQALEEVSFKQSGYDDFYINDFSSSSCTTYDISFAHDVNALVTGILSLKADFKPTPGDFESVSVFLNNDKIGEELNPGDFKAGLARVVLPGQFLQKTNSLKVCGKTSGTVNKLVVFADSEVGLYDTFYFPREDGLTLDLETYSPFVGRTFNIDAVARNYGTKDADVSLSYRKQDLEEALAEINILKGETSKSGTVPKCLERDKALKCTKPGILKISYEAVANKAVPMSVLPAIMTFTNVFGEKESTLSNRPQIGALEPPKDIQAEVFIEKDRLIVNRETGVVVRLKNISEHEVNGVAVALSGSLPQTDGVVVSSIKPNETREVAFKTKPVQTGNHEIGCAAKYNLVQSDCPAISVNVEQAGISAEIVFPILFAIIAIGVFAYFYSRKIQE